MNIKDLVPELSVHPTKKIPKRSLSDIKKLVVHCTDWEITPQELVKYDLGPNHISSTGCPTITYHYFIARDGTVNRTALPEWITWHAGNYNNSSLAITLAYKTDALFEQGKKVIPNPNNIPTIQMMESLHPLLALLCKTYGVIPPNIQGHRELFGTGWIFVKEHKQLRKSCPGMAVDLDLMRKNVALILQKEMIDAKLYSGKLDGIWGPVSDRAFLALRGTLD